MLVHQASAGPGQRLLWTAAPQEKSGPWQHPGYRQCKHSWMPDTEPPHLTSKALEATAIAFFWYKIEEKFMATAEYCKVTWKLFQTSLGLSMLGTKLSWIPLFRAPQHRLPQNTHLYPTHHFEVSREIQTIQPGEPRSSAHPLRGRHFIWWAESCPAPQHPQATKPAWDGSITHTITPNPVAGTYLPAEPPSLTPNKPSINSWPED